MGVLDKFLIDKLESVDKNLEKNTEDLQQFVNKKVMLLKESKDS